MSKPRAVLTLCLRFPWAVLVSGVKTLATILSLRRRPPSGFVRVPYAPLSDTGLAFLSCMVTSTPGTTVIAADRARREVQLHLLDASHPQSTIDGIRRDFERPLQALFGAPEGSGAET